MPAARRAQGSLPERPVCTPAGAPRKPPGLSAACERNAGQPRRFRGLGARHGRRSEHAAGRSSRLSRLLGLALLDRASGPEGLLIPRCRSVHTFGMRFPLDVVFLDDRFAPISVRGSLPPSRVVRDRRAAAVVELPAADERRSR